MSPRLRRGGGSGEPLPIRLPPGMLAALRDGAVPLDPGAADRSDATALRVAVVIPQFRRGSGGHKTIADLVRELEALGHDVSLWVVDEEDRHAGASDADLRSQFHDFFGAMRADVARLSPTSLAGEPADVVVATGWQTVPAVLRLRGARARAYLVQDHEPEFYATSVEREWAAWTYRQGLHAICASPWLATLVREEYGGTATSFDLGVDHDVYRTQAVHRREDLVLFYARAVTPRRGVPLGVLALEELHRRRPEIEIAFFGEARPLRVPFPARELGVLDPAGLTHAYNSATVGLVLSLTNPSLVPTEMLACGLPVVDLAVPSMVATFGADGPISLAPVDPVGIADAVELLLDDLLVRAQRSRDGVAYAAGRAWPGAARQVEAGLREALRISSV